MRLESRSFIFSHRTTLISVASIETCQAPLSLLVNLRSTRTTLALDGHSISEPSANLPQYFVVCLECAFASNGHLTLDYGQKKSEKIQRISATYTCNGKKVQSQAPKEAAKR
jgi:hypothetical protein